MTTLQQGRGSGTRAQRGAGPQCREVEHLHFGRARPARAAVTRPERQAVHDGSRPAAAEDARQADAVRLLPAALRAGEPHDAVRPAGAEERRSEKIVLACLLHDIAVSAFIRADHGYWAAQLLEPYVDEEVTWAIRYHQALRFFPDESAGYAIPEPTQAVRCGLPARALHRPGLPEARDHKWYMCSRLICSTTSTRSIQPSVWSSRSSPTSSAGTSSSRRRASASTQAPRAHVAHDQLPDEVPAHLQVRRIEAFGEPA